MVKYLFSLLCAVTVLLAISSAAPQFQKPSETKLENEKSDSGDELEEGADKEDLKGSASYGYGYYGYPSSGFYGGYPYSYGLHGGYYGGYYPYYGGYGGFGGYGFHGHYF